MRRGSPQPAPRMLGHGALPHIATPPVVVPLYGSAIAGGALSAPRSAAPERTPGYSLIDLSCPVKRQTPVTPVPGFRRVWVLRKGRFVQVAQSRLGITN